MKVHVVVSVSCQACGKMAIAAFDHSPTKEESDEVNMECGGMYCIRQKIVEVELNDASILMNQE